MSERPEIKPYMVVRYRYFNAAPFYVLVTETEEGLVGGYGMEVDDSYSDVVRLVGMRTINVNCIDAVFDKGPTCWKAPVPTTLARLLRGRLPWTWVRDISPVVGTPVAKELTVYQIEKELGYKIRVVGEHAAAQR